MSKSIGRVFGTGAISSYGYETDYMQYLRGYNPYNYEQTLQNMMANAVNVNVQPDYQESLLKKLNRWAVHQNNKLLDYISINDWTATPAGWGHQRIPIQALPNTNTFGRHSMYVHGGDNGFGSSGCIDLERGMPDFYNDWLNYNGNLPLKVKYPKGW